MPKNTETRDLFIAKYLINKNIPDLKRQFFPNVGLSTLYLWAKSLKSQGNLRPIKASGRPKKFNERDLRSLKRSATNNPENSVARIGSGAGLEAHHQTIVKYLKKLNLKSFIKLKRPKLTARHIRDRLQWARSHANLDLDAWKGWSFSDESSVELDCCEGVQRVVINRGQRYEPRFLAGKRQNGGGKLMIWSYISWNGVGPLEFIEGGMDGPKYKRLLHRHVLPHCLTQMGPNGEVHTYMDDGASCHNCDLVIDYCAEKGIKRPDWPANSPDMNPIEWVWGDMKLKLSALPQKPASIAELKLILTRIWGEYTVEYIQKLYGTMENRIQTLIAKNGANTNF